MTAGAAWRSCTGANAHTTRPAQPRRRSPASTSSRALPPSPVTTPMQRGSAGRGSRFCGANSPSACSARRSRSSCASRSPSPATRTSRDRERERRRGRARAGVVVAAAGRDDPPAVGERRRQRVEVLAPHRAGQRAALVAQLEPDARPAGAQVEDLAEHLHARELAQLLAQPVGVLPDRPRAAQRGAGDAVGTAGCAGSPGMGVAERTRRLGRTGGDVARLVQMRRDLGTFLAWALRAQAGRGPHAELARQVVLAVLVAQLLAGGAARRAAARRTARAAPGAAAAPAGLVSRVARRPPPARLAAGRAFCVLRRLVLAEARQRALPVLPRLAAHLAGERRAARAARSRARPRSAPGRRAAAGRSACGCGCAAGARSAGSTRP